MKDNAIYKNDEFDLLDIIKILLSKAKLLICITLLSAIIGGALGGAITLLGIREYGTQVEFYITPNSPDSNVLHLLASERFAEKLLLDENGLPENRSGAEYEAALAAKHEADAAAKALTEAKKLSKEAPRALAIAQKNYEEKQKAYEDVYNLLNIYKSATSDKIAEDPEHVQKMKQYEADLETAKQAKKIAEEEYYAASQTDLEATHKLEAAKEAAASARKKADDLAEDILEQWREEAKNKKKISLINESLSYKYIDVETADKATGETTNRQFLIVSISVERDEALAKRLLCNIRDRLPVFVEENIDTSNSDEETVCTLISTAAEIENLSKNSLIKEIVKFALISAFMALAVTCIVVVWVGMSKKSPAAKEENDIHAPFENDKE
ncbi:MAG: hypothetical protein IKA68_02920 [Clostridia bacterium]|nr:hypothetical protein [Clostridia bacterium]MBR2613305.1 hypothetical protein [Clostridia bacterium]